MHQSNLLLTEQIVSSCLKLQEINLTGTKISRETITFLCKNLPQTLLKLGLSYLKVTDENMQDLMQRCDKMVEIDLHGTEITGYFFLDRSKNQTLVSNPKTRNFCRQRSVSNFDIALFLSSLF